jgi:hypothetical protein
VNRYLKAAVLSVSSVFATVTALAHEEFNFAGTVIRQDDKGLQIRTTGGDIVSVNYFVVTRFWRGEQKVTVADVKTGASVDVRAYGDSVEDLLALDVKITPPRAGMPQP